MRLTDDESVGATPEDDAAYAAYVAAHKAEMAYLDEITEAF